MKEINKEAGNRYFSELQLQLNRAGFEVGEAKDGNVDVLWEGATLCQANMMEKEYCYIPRCDDCPYCGHGFICRGKDGRCMRTEAARINHFEITGGREHDNSGDTEQ